MAATSRPQQRPSRRSPRRLILDSFRATAGRGRATVNRIRVQAPRQAGAIGKPALRRLRALGDRSVAGIRYLIGQGARTTRHLPLLGSRQVNRLTQNDPNLAADRGLTAVEPTAASERRQVAVKPVKARGRTRQTRERQGKPRQAKRRQDLVLEQQTVRELRERAREAGVQGRSSMTKDQLIEALREHR